MAIGGEAAHIRADLGHDGAGAEVADPRDRGQDGDRRAKGLDVGVDLVRRERVQRSLFHARRSVAASHVRDMSTQYPYGPIRSVSNATRSPASITRAEHSWNQGFVRGPDVSSRVSIHSPPRRMFGRLILL